MTTDINHLEVLAKAANVGSNRLVYAAAASPDVILDLIRRVREAERALSLAKHLHRTDPSDALDRRTIRTVARNDGFVHSADVLRLLDDAEKAENERDALRAERNSLREASIPEYASALGEIEAALGICGAAPVADTVERVRALRAERDAARVDGRMLEEAARRLGVETDGLKPAHVFRAIEALKSERDALREHGKGGET